MLDDARTHLLRAGEAGDAETAAEILAHALAARPPAPDEQRAEDVVAFVSSRAGSWEALLLEEVAEPLGCLVRVVPSMEATTGMWLYAHHVLGAGGRARLAVAAAGSIRPVIAGARRAAQGPQKAGADGRGTFVDRFAAAWPAALEREGLAATPPAWLVAAARGPERGVQT